MRRFNLTRIGNGVNDFMDDMFEKLPFVGFNLDMKVTDKEFVIIGDLPGYDKKDIDLSVVNGVLAIKVSKDEENEAKDGKYIIKERSSGKMVRNIVLYDDMDLDKISASLDKGILTITIPKITAPEKDSKKIEIK